MRITQEHIDRLYMADVMDQDGEKVGGVDQVYLDDHTGEPAWVTVKTGLFGNNQSFVPLSSADYQDGQIRVPYTKDHIKDSPSTDADQHLSESQQDELFRYYDLEGQRVGRGTAGDLEEGDRMTLHEEHVDVGTEEVETGKVRLRKHVVTDQETVTVPVQREEVEIVREPVGDAEVGDRSDLGEETVEVTTHEERPVIEKDVVATEQVGVDRRTVTGERDVVTDVSHEEVDVEGTRPGGMPRDEHDR